MQALLKRYFIELEILDSEVLMSKINHKINESYFNDVNNI